MNLDKGIEKKKKENLAIASDAIAPDGTDDSVVVEKLTLDAKKALFQLYDAADAKYKTAEAALKTAAQHRSDAVKAIRHACGAGPFEWRGRDLVAMSHGGSYFFRGPGRNIEKIG